MLAGCPEDIVITTEYPKQDRKIDFKNISVRLVFYYPPGPKGFSAGYTAPLVKWEKSEISGLTTTPFTLTNYFAHSFRPEHHNFSEAFLFEPAVDENVPQSVKDELKNKNIRYLYLETGGVAAVKAMTIGYDDKMTKIFP